MWNALLEGRKVLRERLCNRSNNEAALGIVNRLNGDNFFDTPVKFENGFNAQCIDAEGNIRVFGPGGRRYVITVKEIS